MTHFDEQFQKLTGNLPFPWQKRLYEMFLTNAVPAVCDIPTGLGKTAVIAIWLLARAAGANLPRRLVYVVNRRTVVDQTTDEVNRLSLRLKDAELEDGLAISTLRGALADNQAWSNDPSKPAVICGTIDMIGSRLLFSGYRIGFKNRPLHAGFLGQDALIVHDEAHLEPAFQRLIEGIETEQRRAGDPWPLRVMSLSATPRLGAASFGLDAADRKNSKVASRLNAHKQLVVHACNDDALVDAVEERALSLRHSKRAVVIYLRKVEDVLEVVKRLKKAGCSVQQLTGTMRGLERDRLVVEDPVMKEFLSENKSVPEQSAYLVCTSAGEVGVNLSSDDGVCDLSTFDSMAQRFGRMNRFGVRDDSVVHVLCPDPEQIKGTNAEQRRLTRQLLCELNGDASPAAIGRLSLESRLAAFAKAPATLPVTDMLLDVWAMTSIVGAHPGRPPVAPYLHGVGWEPPQTSVAWRHDVEEGAGLSPAELAKWLAAYPLKPHELLSDSTTRVVATLGQLVRKASGSTRAWVLSATNTVETIDLKELLSDREAAEEALADQTLILSPEFCSPVGGVLAADGAPDEAADVADEWLGADGSRLRARVYDGDAAPSGMRLVRVVTKRDDDGEVQSRWRWYVRPSVADDEGSRSAIASVLLDVHGRDAEAAARRITDGLTLSPEIRRAVVLAAGLHDIGKARRLWQVSVGNAPGAAPLAKTGGRSAPRQIATHYRHELGSAIDARGMDELSGLDAEALDLVLHLIVAHHGRARPHFDECELFDPETPSVDGKTLGVEIAQRYARLQKRFGRWGLAYLESLVRAADREASRKPSATVEE